MSLLHSKILGEGSPLLILHGFLGMSDNWKTLGNRYAENNLEVHLIDQRNHGRSFHSPDFDYEFMAEDVLQYMNHHSIDEAIILGHSMGGKTAMQIATVSPNRVKKLLVADIAPKYYPPHHQEIINALLALPLGELDSRGEADKELAKHLSDFGIRQFLLKNLYRETKDSFGLRFNLEVLQNKMEEIGENIAPTSIFEKPTLFLRGDRSEYIMPSDEVVIRQNFPNSSIVTIDNAGHWLHAENPDQFFKKTMVFINQ